MNASRCNRAHTPQTAFAVCLAICLLAAPAIPAQPPAVQLPAWQIAAGGTRSFEVASLKQRVGFTRLTNNLSSREGDAVHSGLFSATGYLLNFVTFAYKLNASQSKTLIDHLPSWAFDAQYDLEARSADSSTVDQQRLMMQALLAERFHLIAHIERRDAPVYVMTLEKPATAGPFLKPHPTGQTCVNRPKTPAKSVVAGPRPVYCGATADIIDGVTHQYLQEITMTELADYVSSVGTYMGGLDQRPVIDKTGLIGSFDAQLNYVRDTGMATAGETAGPTFTEALRSKLGLKLSKQTGPVEVFIIDHIEKLSAD